MGMTVAASTTPSATTAPTPTPTTTTTPTTTIANALPSSSTTLASKLTQTLAKVTAALASPATPSPTFLSAHQPTLAPTNHQLPPTVGAPTISLKLIADKTNGDDDDDDDDEDDVPTDATCVEFLGLMKAFSESSVNVSEMAQRVDSLVHQDEQLLRLLPLATPRGSEDGGGRGSMSSRGSTTGSSPVGDMTDDDSCSAASSSRVNVAMTSRAIKKWPAPATVVGAADDDEDDHDDEDDGDDDDDDDEEEYDDDDFVSDDMDVDDDDDDDDEDMDEENDHDDDDDDDDGSSTDADTHRSSSSQRIGSFGADDDDEDEVLDEHTREQRAQEDLQRWMELELDLDSAMDDPYDASLHLPGVGCPALHGMASSPFLHISTRNTSTATNTTTGHGSPVVSGHSTLAVTGSHANSSSVLGSMATKPMASSTTDRFRALAVSSVLSKKSVTAALFDDDEDDEGDDGEGTDSTDHGLLSSLMSKKRNAAGTTPTADSAASKSSSLVGKKRPREQEEERKSEEEEHDAHGGLIWGMEVDTYEQDLLSSIDHAVLCDRENRFLQWDLEIEAATAAAAAAAVASNNHHHHHKVELRTPPLSAFSSVATAAPPVPVASTTTATESIARQKMLMASSSPRNHKATKPTVRSPSNVDTNLIAEDWSRLDFGTFQNRTVSHILSSCLHKRKLHHPYKDHVTLVNFNVPGGEPIGPLPPQGVGSSTLVTSSLLFGAGLTPADIMMKKDAHGTVFGMLSASNNTSGTTKKDGKPMKTTGERKPKKPRDGERKKSQKQGEFGVFGDHEMDGRGGNNGKMMMTKLENLPLPDYANLPQDLKDLKRKIEATEHKVEGTKHRHRKGGPCPRCQVQNQLRAAKRAYHKRAVAHKKLPQLGTVSPALTATAVVALSNEDVSTAGGLAGVTAVVAPPPAPVQAQVDPVAVVGSSTVVPMVELAKPTVLKVVGSSSVNTSVATMNVAAATVAAAHAAVVVRPATTPVMVPSVAAHVAAPPAIVAARASGLLSAPSAQPTTVVSTPLAMATASASAGVATPAPFPRRSCGENALASPFASPSSVPSSGSTPSSPESSPPPVHHPTVTSA